MLARDGVEAVQVPGQFTDVNQAVAHGKEKKLIATNDMDSAVRATPTSVNGVLYVLTENKLYAIANK